jgi:hypothetical protein
MPGRRNDRLMRWLGEFAIATSRGRKRRPLKVL